MIANLIPRNLLVEVSNDLRAIFWMINSLPKKEPYVTTVCAIHAQMLALRHTNMQANTVIRCGWSADGMASGTCPAPDWETQRCNTSEAGRQSMHFPQRHEAPFPQQEETLIRLSLCISKDERPDRSCELMYKKKSSRSRNWSWHCSVRRRKTQSDPAVFINPGRSMTMTTMMAIAASLPAHQQEHLLQRPTWQT